jgi:hypothetical protein
MTTMIANTSVRQVNLGTMVSRATATLPASALGAIFNITGGRILIRALIGEVTTVIQTQACTVKVTSTPTVGSAVDLSAVSASISALEVGGRLTLPAAAATALVVGNAGGLIGDQAKWIIGAGSLGITTSATNTGSVKWDLIYVPIDVGASVVAA